MKSPALRSLTVALLFILGTFATPFHLVIDAHEWDHHESPAPEDHDDSHHESHPATDHDLISIATTLRPAPLVLHFVAFVVEFVSFDVQAWTPTVEAGANSPPSSPESPPRSPRAPPL
jgi:hypothetical protein